MSADFYHQLPSFETFSSCTEDRHYQPVPHDWFVVLSDVTGSTQAISAGKYKEVNLAGAASIIAVLNVAHGTELPYVFGGDGATLLVPPELTGPAMAALSGVQRKIRQAFDLDLRVGMVPVEALAASGAQLEVAKYRLSKHITQAMLRGDGVGMAEQWIKSRRGMFIAPPPEATGEADFTGLECRWEPVQNRNGEMVSLIVRVSDAQEAEAGRIYTEIIRRIESLYGNDGSAFPVQPQALHLSSSPRTLRGEARLRGGDSAFSRAKYMAWLLAVLALGRYALRNKIRIGTFDGAAYRDEFVANTDARKFDNTLRMVLDSTPEKRVALEAYLEQRRKRGEIVYGVQVSSQALMTCLVFALEGNHVHFVDGANGGYAVAAKQMKEQMKQAEGIAA